MSNLISIQKPELLQIDDNGIRRYGANQIWYPQTWQRKAGCGPTTCSHLFWYLSKTRTECGSLWEQECRTRSEYVKLMEAVFEYVTPGPMGVNTPALFTDGAFQYGRARNVELKADVLQIPSFHQARPSIDTMKEFLTKGFQKDLPAAFLNLSNGELRNLESWHWVTLIGIKEEEGLMYDQGKSSFIDLKRWLKTTIMGGAFVFLSPA